MKGRYSTVTEPNKEETEKWLKGGKTRGFWHNKENQMKYLHAFAYVNGITTREEWEKVTREKFEEWGGRRLLREYGSLPSLFSSLLSSFSWEDTKMKKPQNYWKEERNQKRFLQQFAKEMNIKEEMDWNNVKVKDIRKHGGSGFLFQFNGNLYNAINKLIFNNEQKVEENKEKELQTKEHSLFLHIQHSLAIETEEDWYKVRANQISSLSPSAHRLLLKHRSVHRLVSHFVQYDWEKKKFVNGMVEKGHWLILANRISFFNEVYEKLSLKRKEDWYKVKYKEITNLGGKTLFSIYRTLIEALRDTYREEEWDILQCSSLPRHFWSSLDNQRAFLSQLALQLNVHSLDDWYKVDYNIVYSSKGGKSFLRLYNGNFFKGLTSVYPDHQWDIFRSSSSRKINHVQLADFMRKLMTTFDIRRKDDFYRVSKRMVATLLKEGKSVLASIGFHHLLLHCFPAEDWSFHEMKKRSKKAVQRWLMICLKKQLGGEIHFLEDYEHPLISFSSGSLIELDLFIPSLNIAFEYNGEQHYDDIPSAFNPIELNRDRDLQKVNLCLENRIQLLIIPYWWDLSPSSLSSFLLSSPFSFHFSRPNK